MGQYASRDVVNAVIFDEFGTKLVNCDFLKNGKIALHHSSQDEIILETEIMSDEILSFIANKVINKKTDFEKELDFSDYDQYEFQLENKKCKMVCYSQLMDCEYGMPTSVAYIFENLEFVNDFSVEHNNLDVYTYKLKFIVDANADGKKMLMRVKRKYK